MDLGMDRSGPNCTNKLDMIYYKQVRNVNWLKTPAGTVWITTHDSYIQPEDVALITTPLGVDLDLLGDEDETLFELINTVKI